MRLNANRGGKTANALARGWYRAAADQQHTDFDPLRSHPQVGTCSFIGPGQPIPTRT